VGLAQGILEDNEARLKVGRGSELEVLEARAGLALRQSKQAEARQLFFEALNRLNALYSESALTTSNVVVAVDEPQVGEVPLTFFEGWQSAFEWNPDYLIQKKKLDQEQIRLVYARNQRMPQLDLKASYGLNGLGADPGESWDDLEHTSFPSWAVRCGDADSAGRRDEDAQRAGDSQIAQATGAGFDEGPRDADCECAGHVVAESAWRPR